VIVLTGFQGRPTQTALSLSLSLTEKEQKLLERDIIIRERKITLRLSTPDSLFIRKYIFPSNS
jgi:hypothetical protein